MKQVNSKITYVVVAEDSVGIIGDDGAEVLDSVVDVALPDQENELVERLLVNVMDDPDRVSEDSDEETELDEVTEEDP